MQSEEPSPVDALSNELSTLDAESFPTLNALAECGTYNLFIFLSELFRLRGGITEFSDIISNNSVKVRAKVMIPPSGSVPGVSYVGKLLGPGGKTLKSLQETTMTRLSILGSGSSRDDDKEKELLASGDPKYLHLKQKLHLQIDATAPPAEAYYRISCALTEVHKIMVMSDATAQNPWTPDASSFQPNPPMLQQPNFSPRGRGGRPFGRGNFSSPRGRFNTPNGINGQSGAPQPSIPSLMANTQPNNGFQNNTFDQFAAGYGNDGNWTSAPQPNVRGRGRAHPYARPAT